MTGVLSLRPVRAFGTPLDFAHTELMWWWIVVGLLVWLAVSAAVAFAAGVFLRVAEREEELVELQRDQRDHARPPLLN